MLWERIFVFFSEAGSSTSTREESARRGSGLGEPLSVENLQSISLWCSRLYCVSPLCAILCIDVGLRVLCDAQLDILGIAACPVSSDQSHLSPLITLGASKTGPRPGASVLTPAVHPGPDVQSRITALSRRAVSGPRSNSRTHVRQMSSNECSLCTRDFEQLGPRQVW